MRAQQMLTSGTTCWCIAVSAAGNSSNPEVLAIGSMHGMFMLTKFVMLVM